MDISHFSILIATSRNAFFNSHRQGKKKQIAAIDKEGFYKGEQVGFVQICKVVCELPFELGFGVFLKKFPSHCLEQPGPPFTSERQQERLTQSVYYGYKVLYRCSNFSITWAPEEDPIVYWQVLQAFVLTKPSLIQSCSCFIYGCAEDGFVNGPTGYSDYHFCSRTASSIPFNPEDPNAPHGTSSLIREFSTQDLAKVKENFNLILDHYEKWTGRAQEVLDHWWDVVFLEKTKDLRLFYQKIFSFFNLFFCKSFEDNFSQTLDRVQNWLGPKTPEGLIDDLQKSWDSIHNDIIQGRCRRITKNSPEEDRRVCRLAWGACCVIKTLLSSPKAKIAKYDAINSDVDAKDFFACPNSR
jgi:hypothetical protein